MSLDSFFLCSTLLSRTVRAAASDLVWKCLWASGGQSPSKHRNCSSVVSTSVGVLGFGFGLKGFVFVLLEHPLLTVEILQKFGTMMVCQLYVPNSYVFVLRFDHI